MPTQLPIDDSIATILAAIQSNPITVIQAPPGSGKTTRVAPALVRLIQQVTSENSASNRSVSSGRIYLLQPRRLAARSVAARIAVEQGWRLGGQVGYQVRFEKKFQSDTSLIVATEGVLVKRLQDDATLSNVSIVLLDEFHERSLDSDLLLGLLRQVQQTLREDLRIVIMSATLDGQSLSTAVGDCPVINVPGKMFPVDIRYKPLNVRESVVEATVRVTLEALTRHDGDILVFLPGQGEIHRVKDRLQHQSELRDVSVLTLFGNMPLEDQARVIQPMAQRKVVLSTNVAETSLTIEGITVVIDSGLARVMRFESAVGLDRLNLEPISQASAIQRAGRAGRVAPGICYRLWSEVAQRSRPEYLEPEIRRVDLTSAVLQLIEWGEKDFNQFLWITPPRPESVDSSLKLLGRLGAIDKQRQITKLGKFLVALPLHPRLARMVIEGYRLKHLSPCCFAAALLSERDPFQANDFRSRNPKHKGSMFTHSTRRWSSDVVARIEAIQEYLQTGNDQTELGTIHRQGVQNILQVAKDIEQQLLDLMEATADLSMSIGQDESIVWEEAVMRSLLTGYPDRLAKRRSLGKNSALMVGGRAVQLAATSGVHDEELFLCIDVDGGGIDALVRQASAIDSSWLDPDLIETRDELFFHPTQQQVVARRCTVWDDLVLNTTPIAVEDRDLAADVLFAEAIKVWPTLIPKDNADFLSIVHRNEWLRSVVPDIDLPVLDEVAIKEVCRELCNHHRSIPELKKAKWGDWILARFSSQQKQLLDREAPDRIVVPSGSSIKVEYELGKPPVLAVKIQEIFSWHSTPRIAMGRVGLLLHLLAPNMRPQQITEDLASFWRSGYAEVKKELKRRYPKHSWPDDPTTAVPSKR